MEQMIEFLLNHPYLTLAFVGIMGALVWTQLQAGSRATRLSPMDATRLISHEDAVVLDVRGDGAYRAGHILNAVHVPIDPLSTQAKMLAKYRGRPIIATCRTGQRSAEALKTLRGLGFERLYTLSGGIAAWEGANLPLSKDAK
jgi:rhodanese-related sulfurtransferase